MYVKYILGIFNTLLCIFNTYFHIDICGPHTAMAKNTGKTQEKPNPSRLFQSTN
jgi:hypothetical protein